MITHWRQYKLIGNRVMGLVKRQVNPRAVEARVRTRRAGVGLIVTRKAVGVQYAVKALGLKSEGAATIGRAR